MTDEQIADVARLEPVIGKTHAEWYAEACRVTPNCPKTTHAEVLWACRMRTALYVLGRDMGALADAAEKLVKAIRSPFPGGLGQAEDIQSGIEAVKKALWWKQ